MTTFLILFLLVVLVLVFVWAIAMSKQQAAPTQSYGALVPMQGQGQALAPSSFSTAASMHSQMQAALNINNPISAWVNTVGTNARVTALENAERLARAAEEAANAEAAGIEALIRRADQFDELVARQLSEQQVRTNLLLEHAISWKWTMHVVSPRG